MLKLELCPQPGNPECWPDTSHRMALARWLYFSAVVVTCRIFCGSGIVVWITLGCSPVPAQTFSRMQMLHASRQPSERNFQFLPLLGFANRMGSFSRSIVCVWWCVGNKLSKGAAGWLGAKCSPFPAWQRCGTWNVWWHWALFPESMLWRAEVSKC